MSLFFIQTDYDWSRFCLGMSLPHKNTLSGTTHTHTPERKQARKCAFYLAGWLLLVRSFAFVSMTNKVSSLLLTAVLIEY